MDMLGSAVAGIVRVAYVGSPANIDTLNEVIGHSAVSKMQVDLVCSAYNVLQNDVIGAVSISIRATITRRDNCGCTRRIQGKMTSISEVVGILADVLTTAWITKGWIIMEMENRALKFVGSAFDVWEVIAPDGLRTRIGSFWIGRLEFGW